MRPTLLVVVAGAVAMTSVPCLLTHLASRELAAFACFVPAAAAVETFINIHPLTVQEPDQCSGERITTRKAILLFAIYSASAPEMISTSSVVIAAWRVRLYWIDRRLILSPALRVRSEARRVGAEGVSSCNVRWSAYH